MAYQVIILDEVFGSLNAIGSCHFTDTLCNDPESCIRTYNWYDEASNKVNNYIFKLIN